MKPAWLIGLAASVVALLAGVYFLQGSHAPNGQTPLVAIDGPALTALQAEFNRRPENVRVILLLSPT